MSLHVKVDSHLQYFVPSPKVMSRWYPRMVGNFRPTGWCCVHRVATLRPCLAQICGMKERVKK